MLSIGQQEVVLLFLILTSTTLLFNLISFIVNEEKFKLRLKVSVKLLLLIFVILFLYIGLIFLVNTFNI